MSNTTIRGQREHWQTPVCDYPWLILRELQVHSSKLEIEVYYHAENQSRCFKFIWEEHYAHRSTNAAAYLAWDLDTDESNWRNTHKILNSGWLSELVKNHDNNYDFPILQHFVLCTADHVTEILSEVEPLIKQWIVQTEKPTTSEKSQFELSVPEPMTFFASIDEANFYNTLKDLPEVRNITTYGRRTWKERNEIVLSLSCQFLCNSSLRALIGLLARYKLPMASLSSQHGQHNDEWFKDSRAYWYKSVFGHLK
jgi:hypothetical protein